uniref:Uncharacterized protein n=1 Tax=Romanomermis culicivorax TaxID=13658 RepID=A0A915HKT8_ROMCU
MKSNEQYANLGQKAIYKRITAILPKTIDDNLHPNLTERKFLFSSATFRRLHSVPFRRKRQV